ncbi:copper homeostasis protein CutC domain protein [Oesophagostomum dentatum]|uniref:Copper homeostasis protein cutC homolog n=1 Tax=Oesophagostomum dentatum TaxID=61180 RepID=A0A0B1SXV3_OESDE|nr:copper homeostasis protein CutC domain protein [Oesophagostomum dentatum]
MLVFLGADQLEVCSALALGGLTPSIGLVRRIRASFPKVPLFVMLRPRGGDFVYSDEEFHVMQEDLRAMKQAGVAGFVFGILLSGQAATALDGTTRIKKIRQEAGDKINILVGSGVNSQTLPILLSETGCSWFHGSASAPVEPKGIPNGVKMGRHDTDAVRVTDRDEVSNMRDQLNEYFGSRPLVTPYY